MGRGLVVNIDPKELNPLALTLVGKLGEVLVGAGSIEAQDKTRGWRRHQHFRYFCGSEAFARLVRLQVLVADEIRYTITPEGQIDKFDLDGLIPEGAPFKIRLIRDPETDPAVLPNPFPDIDVRFEVFG